jgi:hypothetical protein
LEEAQEKNYSTFVKILESFTCLTFTQLASVENDLHNNGATTTTSEGGNIELLYLAEGITSSLLATIMFS